MSGPKNGGCSRETGGGIRSAPRRWRWIALAAFVILTVLAPPAAAQAISNKDCLDCHSDKDLTKTNELGKTISFSST
ncbi:MAG: hypothetical protein U1G07_05455 [Verrucomicrobiota bacterium]